MELETETATRIGNLLIKRGEKVNVAESSTGGLISATLLSVPGASGFYEGGSVVYTLASRRAFLELDREKLKTLKPLTEEMVIEFAKSARKTLGTAWAIAELGAAGPAGTPYGHGPGVSVIGVAGPVMAATTVNTGSDNRAENMAAFTKAAMDLFEQTLKSAG